MVESDDPEIKSRELATPASEHNYTLEDFVKNPFKDLSFKSIWKETQYDLDFSDLFSGKAKILKNNLALFASFGIAAVPHELIHAGVNKLTGGINKEIVINTLYGGHLWEKMFPEIHSKLMIPFIGGYVHAENPSFTGNIATSVAPYILTPLGIYLVQKGKEKESKVLAAAGGGLVAAHIGGVIGDWLSVGARTINEGVEVVEHKLDAKPEGYAASAAGVATLLGGLYLGSKLMAITYRGMKATVNSARKYAGKEE